MDINRIYRIESVEKPVNEPADEPYFNPQEVSYRQPVSGETSGYETMEEPGSDRDKAMEEPEKPEKAGEIESTVPEPESVEGEVGVMLRSVLRSLLKERSMNQNPVQQLMKPWRNLKNP